MSAPADYLSLNEGATVQTEVNPAQNLAVLTGDGAAQLPISTLVNYLGGRGGSIVATIDPAAASQTLDASDGTSIFLVNLTQASTALTLTPPAEVPEGRLLTLTIVLIQGTGSNVVTWTDTVAWVNGDIPLVNPTEGSVTVVQLNYNGTSWSQQTDVVANAKGQPNGLASLDALGALAVRQRRTNVPSIGNVTGTVNIDVQAASAYSITLAGDTTLNFTNLPTGQQGVDLTLYVHQDTTGNHALTFPSSTKFPGGPWVNTQAAQAIDVVGMTIFNTVAYGYPVENFV